jgi:hypothetical protein
MTGRVHSRCKGAEVGQCLGSGGTDGRQLCHWRTRMFNGDKVGREGLRWKRKAATALGRPCRHLDSFYSEM